MIGFFSQLLPHRLPTICISVLVFLCIHTEASSKCRDTLDDNDQMKQNQRRTARITIKSPGLDGNETEEGSGVLISSEGHLLTARHVIEQTIDAKPKGGLLVEQWRKGSSIRVRFYNGENKEEPDEYEAEWIGEPSKEYDLAVLKLKGEAQEINRRGSAIINPFARMTGNCFEILGTAYWNEEVGGQLGKELPRFERTHAIHMYDLQNWRHAIESTVAKGFSGAPVFAPDNEWNLVGIVIRGREDRPSIKVMRQVRALMGRLKELVPSLRIRPENPYPSRKLIALSRVDFSQASNRQITAFVNRVIKNPSEASKFLHQLTEENFERPEAGPDSQRRWDALQMGRDMLDSMINKMVGQYRIWSPELVTRAIEKSLAIWETIGSDANNVDFKSIIVEKLRSDVAFHRQHCDTSKLERGKFECIRHVEIKQSRHSKRIAGYHGAALDSYLKPTIGINPRAAGDSAAFWGQQRAIGLLEWGDTLLKIGAMNDQMLDTASSSNLVFLGSYDSPKVGSTWAKGVPYYASAADKFLKGMLALAESPRQPRSVKFDPDKSKLISRQLCQRARNALERISNSLRPDAGTDQNNYLAFVVARIDETATNPACSQPKAASKSKLL
jgi:hypothetical protein